MREGIKRSVFWMVYGPVVLVVLGSDLFYLEVGRLIAKPLLMPGIFVYLYTNSRGVAGESRRFITPIFVALLFSWIGDILLMFTGLGEYMFLGGLLAFLAAHLFYIAAFLKSLRLGMRELQVSREPFLKRNPAWIVLFVLLLAGLYGFLYPDLGSLRLPVFIYGVIILAMAAFALNRRGVVPEGSYRLILLGSLFFVFSDSILAINRFTMRLPYGQLQVMVSYIAAQYLIAEGALSQLRSYPSR